MQLHLTSLLSVRHLKVIYKKIATELKARINSDDYAVGDMLPSEKALAAELQVSVMTLRKALALLEEEKLIARRHGSGTCIVRKSNYHGGELEGLTTRCRWWGSPTTAIRLLSSPCLTPRRPLPSS
jgi:GntR family glv operon transcriptional regulator